MDHAKMLEIARNPSRVRTMAATILTALGPKPEDERSEQFLKGLGGYSDRDMLTTREREWLWSLNERTFRSAKAGPYAAWTLVKRVYEGRCELPSDDEDDRIQALYAVGPGIRLSRNEWKWIFAVLRSWDELGPEWIPLD